MEDSQRSESERSHKNKRERDRVKEIHNHFMVLKERLPHKEQAKTRLQILKKAAEYINYLEEMIQGFQEKERVQKGETELNRPSCRYSMVGFFTVVLLSLSFWFNPLI